MNYVSVTLLTAPACGLCDHAKQVLARVGVDHELTITVVSIETPEGQALMVAHRVVFPPAVLIDGQPFSYGRLSERRLRRELDRRVPADPPLRGAPRGRSRTRERE